MTELTPEVFELFRRNPMNFFVNLNVDGPDFTTVPWGKIMVDQQKKDFEAISPMLAWTAGARDRPKTTKAWVQKSRGYSKTTDIAATLAHAITFSPKHLSIDCYADDSDQSKFILDQFNKLLSWNPWLTAYVEAQKNKIYSKATGSSVTFMSRDSGSAFGRTPDFTICDELTHWRDEDMWTAAFSSYMKKKGPLLIACNAGYGSGWQWRVRCMAETGSDWYFSSPHGPPPWRTAEDLAEQEAGMPYNEFRRLWWNEWQSSSGAFLLREDVDKCVDPSLSARSGAPHDGLVYVASIDYAERNDRTVATVGHLEEGKILIDRMDVVDPKLMPGGICRVEWVRNWMDDVAVEFGKRRGRVIFFLDPWGLQTVIQEDSNRHCIIPVQFQQAGFNFRVSYTLRHLILHQRVKWYPGCGRIYDKDGKAYTQGGREEDLCTELAELTTKTSGNHWRFIHEPGKHDDRAMSLGILCLMIVDDTGGNSEWGITPPDTQGRFNLQAV